MAHEGEKGARPRSRRVAEAARAARTRASRAESGQPARRTGGAMDVFGGAVRRRDVFPLLVLHLIEREPAYGNRLIEEIEGITDGVISVNPNTIYPLLRDLEARGLIEGQWEHPDRRTRRFYSITAAGRKEYRRLVTELEPFLDSVIKSVTLIKREIYSDGGAGQAR
jgi:PadR family transcriptional regulator, regulatory protein PadR